MSVDITPQFFSLLTAEEEIIPVDNPMSAMAERVGGFQVGSDEMTFGKIKLQGTRERILFGDATEPLTGVGIFIGLDGSDYEWRAGDPSNDFIHWTGSALNITGELTGGTITGGTITGAIFQTDAAANTGVKITAGGLETYGQRSAWYTVLGVATGSIAADANGLNISCTGGDKELKLDAFPSGFINTRGSIIPQAGGDNTNDLGSATYEFKDLYIDGTANIDSLVADTADINGGTLSAITIDGNWTAASQTCADLGTVTTADINGGTWFGTIDGSWTAASQTCADLGTVTTVDINGGTIDGGTMTSTLVQTSASANTGAKMSSTIAGIAVYGNAFQIFDTGGTARGVVSGIVSPATMQVNASLNTNLLLSANQGNGTIFCVATVLGGQTDNTTDLGTSTVEFKDGFFDGTVQTDALRIDQAPTAETPAASHTITISANGTDYKLLCVPA